MAGNVYDVELQPASVVASRCLVLYAVMAAGKKVSREILVDWLAREGAWEAVSPEEGEFLRSVSPTNQQMMDATWRCEGLASLLWAMCALPELPSMGVLCNVPQIRAVLPELGAETSSFIRGAVLRDRGEILAVLEDTFQAHWHIRDAELNGKPRPVGLNIGVVSERHRALNWLVSRGIDWDDVTTDT